MSESVDFLLKLIRLAIGTETDYSVPEDVNWKEVYELSCSQSVPAIAVDGLQILINKKTDLCLSLDMPENENVKYEWFGQLFSSERLYERHRNVLNILSTIFDGMPFIVMKGLSCAEYYPKPQHRTCGDIDIYLADNFEKSNDIMKSGEIPVNMKYYRHSVSYVGDVMIENHRILSNLRGPKHMSEFEAQLKNIASGCLNGKTGCVKPSPDFNALFLPWHVSVHFAFEKVTLKHLLDWALFIRKDSKLIDMQLYCDAKRKYTFGYGKFADVLTAMSLRYLHIPEDCLPERMLSDAIEVESCLCENILDYMLRGTLKERSSSIWKRRIYNVKNIWQERWKYKEMFGVNFFQFLWYNVFGVLTKKGE